MARLRSGSRPQDAAGLNIKASVPVSTGSPSALSKRRVTRSQSRELEDLSVRPFVDERRWNPSKGGMGRKGLDVVPEESPTKTPTKSPRKSGARSTNSLFLESVEDDWNISGTTIMPSEPETYLDAETMLGTTPDLDWAANGVLEMLIPNSKDAVSIINASKKLADPTNTRNKLLTNKVENLARAARKFSHTDYINVSEVDHLLNSLLQNKNGEPTDWSPTPILHKANCAQFAREILVPKGSMPDRRAIQTVEGFFPSGFMNDTVASVGQRSVGESSLEKQTFELAMEIRTQFVITQIEDRQHGFAFDAVAVLKNAFFVDDPGEVYDSSEAPLRGFGVEGLGGADGHLPARFKDAAWDRYEELRLLFPSDDDGMLNIADLKGAFRWQKFALKVVQWIRKRNEEINVDLGKQRSVKDVSEWFFNDGLDGVDNTSILTSHQSLERSIQGTASPAPTRTHPKPVLATPTRRKSGKSAFFNASVMERLAQRQREPRGAVKPAEPRRNSDTAQSSLQHAAGDSENRRQTLPAPSQRTEPADAEGPEIPESPGFQFAPSDEDLFVREVDIEKSRSPPLRNSGTRDADRSPDRHAPPSRDSSLSPSRIWREANLSSHPQRTQPARKKTPPSFIDHQPNARRVSPISRDASEERAPPRREPVTASRKRTREESPDEEDNFFTQFERALDLPSQRDKKPTQSQRKRPRVEDFDGDNSEDEAAHQLRDNLEVTTTQRSEPRASSAGRGNRPHKMHIPWTEGENKRLIRLIKERGTKWSDIQDQDMIQPEQEGERRFRDRNQVAIKDRARNIVLGFYREKVPLPPNFDKVTIKKTDRKTLETKYGVVFPDA